jgi:hypothetical protein
MMTPDERDALIDATVEACAKVAERFHAQLVPADETSARTTAREIVAEVGAQIASAIRREFAKP